jgi:tripartite-type tricarboxylate transporter receptor subunit TctC
MVKTFVRLVGACFAILASFGTACADDYPIRNITIINAFAAGGPTDAYLRPMAQRLGEWLGKPVIIENQPGASGILAASTVKRSAPDGHTLLAISNTHAINESLNPNRNYKLMQDFTPVTELFTSEHAILVSLKVPVKTLPELIALAKKEPGKLTYASSGPGSTYHLATEMFKSMAGVDILHVPYKASSQARTDLISGQIDMFFDLTGPMLSQIRAGTVRVLATTGKTRSPTLPDVPTASEAGVPGYNAEAWVALLAPAGTPDAVIEKLRSQIVRFMKTPEAERIATTQGVTQVGSTPKELRAFLDDEIVKWAAVVKSAHLEIH